MRLPTVVFVAIIEDRHTDVQVEVFSNDEAAITWAQMEAEENASDGFEVDEMSDEELKAAGWLYCGTYNGEGDCIRVEQVELDKHGP